MSHKTARALLIIPFLMAAAPSFAESVVVAPDGETTTLPEAGMTLEPGSTVVLKPGEAVVVTEFEPVNVGLEGISAWGKTAKGEAWVNIAGMALYQYDEDPAGKSVCNGDCAVAWPPLMAAAGTEGTAGTEEWTVIARDDGTSQWAFRGHPLYTFAKDTVPGEVNGDGVAGFHLAD